MKLAKLTLAVALVAAAVLCFACGGSGSSSGRPNSGKIPTATIPAVLPDPLIINGMPTPAAPSGDTYTVKSGDTPSAIAERLGVSVDELMSLNNISDPTQLEVGQVLKVPASRAATPTPGSARTASTPTPKPTSGPTNTPRPAVTPREGATTYTVQSGDNASDIAARFGITVEQLAAANNTTVDALRSLQVGDVLVIPASGTTPVPTSTSAPTEEPTAAPPTATPTT
jgi:LysM repeat protein